MYVIGDAEVEVLQDILVLVSLVVIGFARCRITILDDELEGAGERSGDEGRLFFG